MDTVIKKKRVSPAKTLEEREKIGIDAVYMVAWFVWCFFLRFVPYGISLPEKELHVGGLLVLYFLNRKRIGFDKPYIWTLVVMMAYYIVITIWKEGTSFGLIPMSMLSWWACLLVGSCVGWNSREIRLFLETIKWSCFICSVSIALQNEPFKGADTIVLFGDEMNRNWVIDVSLPGLIIQLIELVAKKKPSFFDIAVTGILFYACILPISRSEFVATALCCGLVLLYKYRALQHGIDRKKAMRLAALVLVILLIVYAVMPQSYRDRLWSPDSYDSTSNDRVDRWVDGIEMVDDVVFGMGPMYYQNNTDYPWRYYGVHNMFVDMYIASGLIGAGLSVLLFLLFIRKDLLALSFFSYSMIRVMFEAGRTPGTWEILTILAALISLSEARGISVSELLTSIYDRPEPEETAVRPTCIRARQKSRV